MEQEKTEIIIGRYLAGEASPVEIMELKEWLDFSKDNMLYFLQLKKIWDSSEYISNANRIDIKKALNIVKERVVFRSPMSNIWFYWKKIAAVLLIPLILGNLIYFSLCDNKHSEYQEPVYNELCAVFGTRSALKLSDGTSVWLNSGSSIKYPDRFVGNNRKVFLKGEAYFEVESDTEHPFIVETSSVKVKATGTKFNILAYASVVKEEVTLVSGKVEVSLNDNKKDVKSSILDINQHLSFNKSDNTVEITNEDTYKYICWKDGELVFRHEPLSQVMSRISQIFNIDIEIKGKEIQNYPLRATFKDESLEDILKLLKISSPIDYFEVKRVPLPDGSFPRKKVIITPARH